MQVSHQQYTNSATVTGGCTTCPGAPAPSPSPTPTPSPSGGGGGGGITPSPGSGCLVYGTLVTMADGTFKPIEQIQIGDVIKTVSIDGLDSSDGNAWKLFTTTSFSYVNQNSTVVGILDDSWNEYYVINGNLNITFEHPVFVKRDIDYVFTRVINLMIGDYMLSEGGNWVEVETIEKITANVQTINLNVEDCDLYFTNGLLVHNSENVEKLPQGG
jgi:hypothetical protein